MTDLSKTRLRRWRGLAESIGLLLILALLAGLLAGSLFGGGAAIMAISALAVGALLLPQIPAEFVMRLHRARILSVHEAPGLMASIADLSRRAGLSRAPACYLLPTAQLNAFATGDAERGAIAVSTGLLQHLDQRQLAGVLAHEISHLASGDTMLIGLAGSLARAVQLIASFAWFLLLLSLPLMLLGIGIFSPFALLLLLIAPSIALLLMQALSRAREYAADNQAAELLASPRPLAEALQRLEDQQGGPGWWPFRRRDEQVPDWLRSHPPTEERIARLLELEGAADHGLRPQGPIDEDLIIPIRMPRPRQLFRPRPSSIRFPW